MKLLESIMNDTFIAEVAVDDATLEKVKNIIAQHTNRESSYNDTLLRVAAFSNGISKPNPNKPNEINVIPILNALARIGAVIKKPNGTFKRTEVLSKVISQQVNDKTNRVLGGDTSADGRLQTTQTKDMGYMGGDGDAADKLNAAPRSYKQGGKYSGAAKEFVIKTIKEKDEEWIALPDEVKDAVAKLGELSNPLFSFKVLKKLLELQSKKKGYVPFIQYVENLFKDQQYVDAFLDLKAINVVSDDKINNNAVANIRKAIEFMNKPSVEGLTAFDKVNAMLPKFMGSSVKHSANKFRAINNVVTNPKYKSIIDVINSRLTDDQLSSIMTTSSDALQNSPIKRTIKFLASSLSATTVDDLKAKIAEKIKNRENYTSDENAEAKNSGRMDFFSSNFNL